MSTRSHYNVLQLDSVNATPDEIKRAFRRLSMEHHPDKNGNSEESNRAFQEINEAYNVLSDPTKRNNYDFERQMGIGGTTAHGMHGMHMHHMGPMGPMGPMGSNPLDMLFAAMHNAQAQAQHAHMFESMFGPGLGPKIIIHNFTSNAPNVTRSDAGMNFEDLATYDTDMILTISLPEAYAGNGQHPINICYDDAGFIKQTESILISIPPGVTTGHKIQIPGRGNSTSDGRRGTLTIEINVAEHPVFRCDGEADLIVEHRVSLKESLCGFTFELVHLNGRNYKFNCKPGSITSMSETKIMPGLGMNNTGALKIRFSVDLPTSLTQEQMDALSAIL